MEMDRLGWNPYWESVFEPFRADGRVPARVVCEHRDAYDVCCSRGELRSEVSGKFRYGARSRSDLPAVGDWVAISARPEEGAATIHAVLPRKSKFSRKAAGARTEEQVLAANVDAAFLVSGLDGDFNVRRIERYLTLAWEGGVNPVIVLNKADLREDIEGCLMETESVAFGVPVLAVSAVDRRGIEDLRGRLGPGLTGAFLGSSGVGKSSLINALLGEERQLVQAVRADDSRGRHTTTQRELILVPNGGVVIDTPGLRELQLWTDEESLKRSFEDVEAFITQCRFSDCRHQSEPGCAVRAAIEEGALDAARYRSYQKLQRELRHVARKQDQKARLLEKEKWKKISRELRRIEKERDSVFDG
jgi:ribosome biogenesis GTPase